MTPEDTQPQESVSREAGRVLVDAIKQAFDGIKAAIDVAWMLEESDTRPVVVDGKARPMPPLLDEPDDDKAI